MIVTAQLTQVGVLTCLQPPLWYPQGVTIQPSGGSIKGDSIVQLCLANVYVSVPWVKCL